MIERQVRWYMKTDTGDQIELRHRYTIAVLNQPREIDRIRQRFLFALTPADDFIENYDCLIPGSNGLHINIFSFSSRQGEIKHPEEIYDSPNFIKDRNLSDRGEEKLENYARSLIRS